MAREHVRAFADVPGVTLSGIHSRTRARAETLAAEYGVAAVYDSIPELYEKTHANLVVVTVFETAMLAASKACFEFPWTILLEKPPGLNVPDAEEILVSARAKTSKVLVALNRRFLSTTRAALADLARDDGPRFIRVEDQEDLAQAEALGHPPVVRENWMYANSIHVIDYLRVFGRGRVMAVEPIFRWKPDAPGVVVSKVEFDSHDIGLYEGIWNGPGPWAVSVATRQKRWEMRPLERACIQLAGERRLQPVSVHPWDQDFKPGFRLQAEHAVAAALGQRSDCPTLEDALETMRLIWAIFAR